MNNISSLRPASPQAVRIGGARGAKASEADLVLDSIQPSDSFPRPNEAVWFDVSVSNQGDKAAPPFNVRLSGSGVDQEARVKQGLKPGQRTTLQMGPLWTDSFQQTYWVDATADPEGVVPETNKANNEASTTVMTQQPIPQPPIPPIPHPPRVLIAE